MNKLAQVIYNMGRAADRYDLREMLSVDEKQMLAELSSLLGQSNESLAKSIGDEPELTDWGFVPPAPSETPAG